MSYTMANFGISQDLIDIEEEKLGMVTARPQITLSFNRSSPCLQFPCIYGFRHHYQFRIKQDEKSFFKIWFLSRLVQAINPTTREPVAQTNDYLIGVPCSRLVMDVLWRSQVKRVIAKYRLTGMSLSIAVEGCIWKPSTASSLAHPRSNADNEQAIRDQSLSYVYASYDRQKRDRFIRFVRSIEMRTASAFVYLKSLPWERLLKE